MSEALDFMVGLIVFIAGVTGLVILHANPDWGRK